MFHNKKREMGIPGGLAIGLAVSLVTTLLAIAILAWMISSAAVGESSSYWLCGIQLVSAALGALAATICIQKMRLQISLLAGVMYYLTLLGINALFFNGAYADMGVSALMVLLGCTVIAFLPGRKKSSVRKGKKAYR